MNRRRALAALFAAGIAPCAGASQDGGKRVVGYLSGGAGTAELSKRLAELGQIEGKNLRFELRIATGSEDIAAKAAELVRAGPDALVTFSLARTRALRDATRTIPIVSGVVPDPVASGLARSLARPGFNVTGLSGNYSESMDMLIGLLRVALPRRTRILLIRPSRETASAMEFASIVAAGASRSHVAIKVVTVDEMDAIDRVIAGVRDPATEAVFLIPLFEEIELRRIAEIAIQRRAAMVSLHHKLPEVGALMAFTQSYSDPTGRIAALVDKVLRGGNPAEIPFERPDRALFVVNRTTAAAIGIRLPAELLIRATQVIG